MVTLRARKLVVDVLCVIIRKIFFADNSGEMKLHFEKMKHHEKEEEEEIITSNHLIDPAAEPEQSDGDDGFEIVRENGMEVNSKYEMEPNYTELGDNVRMELSHNDGRDISEDKSLSGEEDAEGDDGVISATTTSVLRKRSRGKRTIAKKMFKVK